MDKKILTEIDRLEGIAQAYKRRRPIVPMTGAIEDCDEVRRLLKIIAVHKETMANANSKVGALQDELHCVRADIADAKSKWFDAQEACATANETLDNLMASLSARLER